MHGEELLRHCEALNRQALYSSASSLASFLLVTHNLEWQVYSTYAASLFGLGEYKRAQSAYQTALDMLAGPPFFMTPLLLPPSPFPPPHGTNSCVRSAGLC